MKNLSLFLLVAGLLAGPAYWVYAKFYTGSQAAMLALTKSGQGPRDPWSAPVFKLSQDMAPVGLILHATGHFSPNMDESRPPKDGYQALLTRDGTAAKPLAFSLGVSDVANSHPAFKEHLLFLQVLQAGDYRLDIAPAADPTIQLDQVSLEIRQHLREPDSTVVTVGMLVMILGILGFFL